jgi:hypothetical protein
MRTLRWTLAITIGLILAGGTVAAGQGWSLPPQPWQPSKDVAPADPMRGGTVSIELVGPAQVSPGVMVPDRERAFYHEDGRQTQATFESSDPRLSGQVTMAGNRHYNRDGSMVESEVYAIVNADGSWLGQATGLATAAAAPDPVIGNGLLPAGPGHEDMVILTGQGSYEGLTALLRADWTQQPPVITGAVVRGDAPALPALAMIQ